MVNGRSPYRLRLFGGVAIEGPNGTLTGRAARRHALALTARLATAPGHTIGRELLMALMWPESDEASARHLLNAAVYDLRKTLGGEVLRTEGGDLRLDIQILRPDVVEFDAALEEGALERAVALYSGRLLQGFHLSDALEFEEWAETERERYARRYRSALERLARAAEEARDLTAAERWWSRLRAEDPSNVQVTAHLMQVLDAVGARGRALHLAEEHTRVLREEYGADPDPRIESLAREMRAAPRVSPPFELPPALADDPRSGIDAHPSTLTSRGAAQARRASTSQPAWSRVAIVAIPALALLFVFGLVAREGGDPTGRPATSTDRIVVLPFDVRGNDDLAYLSEGVVDLLSAKLNVPGLIQTVDPEAVLAFVEGGNDRSVDGQAVAERFAARAYIRGMIVQSGQGVVIHASIHDAEGTPEGEAEVTIQGEEAIGDGLDRLAQRLLIDRLGEAGNPLTSTAALTTRSLPALKAYLKGERAFRAGQFEEAAEAFGQAAVADSTFALANYRMSLANLWADRPQTQPFDIDEMALRHSTRLPDRHRYLIEAYVAWRRGDADTAERLYVRILAVYPDDVEAGHQLGETLFHYNPVRGRPILEAREPFERVLKLDPNHWGALWHLAQLAAFERRTGEFERMLARLEALDPTPTKSLEMRALRTFARGDPPAVERLLPELRRADATVLAPIATKVGVYLHDLEGAARIARVLTEPGRPQRDQAIGFATLAYLESARGRPSAARIHLASLDRVDEDRRYGTMEARVFLSLVPYVGQPEEELEAIRRVVDRWQTGIEEVDPPEQDGKYLRFYLLGMLSAALRDSTGAITMASELERARDPVLNVWGAAVRAELLRREGRPAEALAVLREGWRPAWFGWAIGSPALSRAHERFARGELSEQVGQLEEAARWFASFEEHGIHDLVYLAPSHLRQAEVYERMGRHDEAAEQYARFTALWKDCDPELRPIVEDARRKLARLNHASTLTQPTGG